VISLGRSESKEPVRSFAIPARWYTKPWWDVLTAILLILASVPPALFAKRAVIVVGSPNLLDDSWVLDTAFKVSRGVWLGRDVTFTYGPLFQEIESAPSRWLGVSMGTVYATAYCLLLWAAIACCFFSLRLLLPEQPRWKRGMLLLLLFMFWYPGDLRPCLTILVFAVFLRYSCRVAEGTVSPLLAGLVAAAVSGFAFLFSADVGMYAVAAITLSWFGVVIGFRRDGSALRPLAVVVLSSLLGSIAVSLLINAMMGRTLDFAFWRNSWAVVSGYRWIMPAMMSRAGKRYVLVVLLFGIAVFTVRWVYRRLNSTSVSGRSGFLVGGSLFSTLMLQSCLVRSDQGHIAVASFAFILLCGVVLFGLPKGRAGWVALVLAVGASVVFGHYSDGYRPSNVMDRIALLRNPPTTCPAATTEFDGACFPTAFSRLLADASQFVRQHAGPNETMLVFSYQTMLGIGSQRTVAGGLMQSYLASGKTLSELDIAGLERSSPPVGVYFQDGPLSLPVDGVSSFTRSPQVWFWIAEHYRATQELAPGVTGLVRDDNGTNSVSLKSVSLGLPAQNVPIRKRSTLLDLGEVSWPSEADFLHLRVKVGHSFWWKLRKPQRLQLEITRADGSRDLKSFLAEPNQWNDVWFYPWQESDLVRYFQPNESLWRPVVRPSITHLRLWVTPFDWVSAVPDDVSISSADGVKLSRGNH
jgi:hypothetical protein